MADSSLDDFFAKKDKSKKKSKSKIKPDDILAQQGEKPKKKKKPKASETDVKSESVENKKDENAEEWEEVVEEQEPDYTGLKIQTLLVSAKEDEENEGEDGEEGEDGDKEKKEEATGPWNKIQAEDRPAVVPQPEPAQEPLPDLTAGKVQGGKYIPPARRGQNPDGTSPVVVTSSARRKPKVAPNLQSESDFPTLGGASEADRTPSNLRFEEVRSGGKQIEDPSKKKLNLQLDNKFGALQTD